MDRMPKDFLMTSIVRLLAALLLPPSMAWGAPTLPVNGKGSSPDGERASPVLPRCELQVEDRRDSVVLKGIVVTRAPVSGSYQLRVSQNGAEGRSDIVQTGDFNIESGSTGSLGLVSLSKSASRYVAKLIVQWDANVPDCQASAPGGAKQKLLEQKKDSGPLSPAISTLAKPAEANVDLKPKISM
jgi:hypothetical protein